MTPASPAAADAHAISHARAACYELYRQQPAGQSRPAFRKLVAKARQEEPSLAAVSVRQLRKEVLSLSLLDEWERARQQQQQGQVAKRQAGGSAVCTWRARNSQLNCGTKSAEGADAKGERTDRDECTSASQRGWGRRGSLP